MRTKLAVVVLLFMAGCASSDDMPAPSASPLPPSPDPRVGELQTQLTELLERIDVLNDRIARLEETGPVAAASTPVTSPAPARQVQADQRRPQVVPTAPQPSPAAPQAALVSAKIAGDYRNAIVLYGQGKLSDARRAFQEVFEADQQGDLADNAMFWIGETYFAARDYVNAMRFYARVTTDYADQNKAPDALLKTALAQERTGDLALARRTLQQVIERYPYSSSASTAKQDLQRIKY